MVLPHQLVNWNDGVADFDPVLLLIAEEQGRIMDELEPRRRRGERFPTTSGNPYHFLGRLEGHRLRVPSILFQIALEAPTAEGFTRNFVRSNRAGRPSDDVGDVFAVTGIYDTQWPPFQNVQEPFFPLVVVSTMHRGQRIWWAGSPDLGDDGWERIVGENEAGQRIPFRLRPVRRGERVVGYTEDMTVAPRGRLRV